GINAIWALAKLVDRLQGMTNYDRGVTVNVGTFHGGQAKNTVPERAEALVDLRFVRVRDGEALLAAMHQAASDVERAVPGVRMVVEGGIARTPLERTPENVALYAEYAAAARQSGLGSDEAALIA